MTLILRRSLLPLVFLLVACYAGNAIAQIPSCPTSVPPPGPAVNCTKQITIFNYSTTDPLFPVIEVTFRAPPAGDNWLIALNPLNNPNYTYSTNNLYRAYVNPTHGIPPEGALTITIPWYSQLEATPDPTKSDQYVDWFNGGRVYLIDSQAVIDAFFGTEKSPVTPYSGILTCSPFTPPAGASRGRRVAPTTCEQPSLTLYADPPSNGIAADLPNQNVEYTFVNVLTPAGQTPSIGDYNVDYDVSYVDTVYLPVALEPISSPTNIGYLGTDIPVVDMRKDLNDFADARNWPYYTGQYSAPDGEKPPNLTHPWIPGTYKAYTDVGSLSSTNAIAGLIKQWNTCTTTPTPINCPDFKFYQDLYNFYTANYNNYYQPPPQAPKCPTSPSYPLPATLDWSHVPPPPPTPLQYVYGWVPFNSGCTNTNSMYPSNGPSFNDLKLTPGFGDQFFTLQNEFIQLQYNYENSGDNPSLTFNPFVELIHSTKYLNANSYAFSIDDSAGNQNNPGDGIYIAMGGVGDLPNKDPIPPPVNLQTTIQVILGGPKPEGGPAWSKYGICRDTADSGFPGPSATGPDQAGGWTINVNTLAPTYTLPCTITITDAVHGYSYHLTIKNPLPWNAFTPPPNMPPEAPDISCPPADADPGNWCGRISETSKPTAPYQFTLSAPPPNTP